MEQFPNLPLCPYLRSREDDTTAYAYPTHDNRCYARVAPKNLGPDYQASYCLGPDYHQCPFFISTEQAYLKLVSDSTPSSSKAQSILTLLRDRSSSLWVKGASTPQMLEGWSNRLAGEAWEFSGLLSGRLALSARDVQSVGRRSRRVLVVGLGLIILLLLGFSILPRLGASGLLSVGTPVTAPNQAVMEGTMATPSLVQVAAISTATPTLSESQPTATAIQAREVVEATSTQEPSSTSLLPLTAAPSATPSRAATTKESSSKKPSATPTPQATVTPTPEAIVTPTNSPLYAAPLLLEPPDGTLFKRNTILRWSSDHALNQDEVFDVLVWPAGSAQPVSIGNTMQPVFPIDFKSWSYTGHAGTFYWTIRIKGADGAYLSPASPPLSFLLE